MKKFFNSFWSKPDECFICCSVDGKSDTEKQFEMIYNQKYTNYPLLPLSKTYSCNCCTSYIVKREYYDTLLKNFEDGIALFERFPADKSKYACDIYWKWLQNKDRWFLITPICISQRPDYSDIEKCFVNYNDLILNLVKNKNKHKRQ